MSTTTLSLHPTFSTPSPHTYTTLATLHSWTKENIDPFSLRIAGLLGSSEGGKGKLYAEAPKRTPLKEIVLALNETRGRGPGVDVEFLSQLIIDFNEPLTNPDAVPNATQSSAPSFRQTTLARGTLARGPNAKRTEQKDKVNEDVRYMAPTTSGASKIATAERVADRSIATMPKSRIGQKLEANQAEIYASRRVNSTALKTNDENTNQATAVVETKERKKRSAGVGSGSKAKREEGRTVAEAMRKMR